MKTISATDFRKNMSAEADRLSADADFTIVTRTGGGNFVVMSEEDFNSWRETVYLLGSPANAAQLLASLKAANEGEAQERALIRPSAQDD